jgi:hypothetical protein
MGEPDCEGRDEGLLVPGFEDTGDNSPAQSEELFGINIELGQS